MPFSSLAPQLRKKFLEYSKAYDKAESVLKFCEIQQIEGINIASINELRYAGQHLARAFSDSTIDDSIKNFDDALRHVHRSIYDSYDACIMFYLKQCKIFEENYKNVNITTINSNYINEKKTLEEIKIEITNENRNRKEDYYKRKEEQVKILKNIYNKWFICRDELNKLVKKQIRQTWFQFITFIIGTVSIPIVLWCLSNIE